jgi:flagellar biosynthesis protein FlhF
MPTAEKSQLYVKSFFAPSVPEAMEQARQELGLDALLLDTREARPEARHLGRYEVVFGGAIEAAHLPPTPLADAGPVHELRHTSSPAYSRSRNAVVEQALVEAGVEPALAFEIEESVRRRIAKRAVLEIGRPRIPADGDVQKMVAETAAEIASRFEVVPQIGRVTALVGPPGSGKTSTVVKLAITLGLRAGRPVQLISTDTQRIGAAEQVRTYAAILGVPFQAVESTSGLAHAIDTAPPDSLVLIDTPGWSATLLQDRGMELAAFLSQRQEIDTHLVLTASMRAEDLSVVAQRFAVFRPAKLLFTHLDETTSFASMFCQAVRLRKPLSFYCHGQSIPEDLAPAAKDRIVESLVRQLPEALIAVA